MNRTSAILWAGRILTIIFTVSVAWDSYSDGQLSREIREVTLGLVALLFLMLFGWQVRIAWKYEGFPTIPLAFRWVMATWLGSLMLFVVWLVLTSFIEDVFTPYRSAVMWWQFGTSTLWFAPRWLTIDTPHKAGAGETGATIGGGTGPTV